MASVAGAAAPGCGPVGFSSGGSSVAARLPSRVLEHVFSYLDLPDLIRCALVCWHWNNCLSDENSEVWRSLCSRVLSEEAMRSDILCNLPSYKGKVSHEAALFTFAVVFTALNKASMAFEPASSR